MRKYVMITPDDETLDCEPLARIGTRVSQVAGLKAGRMGVTVGWARGVLAHRLFTNAKDAAKAAGRELSANDYEILIDNEGPLVLWDGEVEIDWFPGQSMGLLDAISPASEVVTGPPELAPGHVRPDRIVEALGDALVGVLRRYGYGGACAVQESDGYRVVIGADGNIHDGSVRFPPISAEINVTP